MSRSHSTSGFNHEAAVSQTTVWLTPPSILQALGPFDLDPCAARNQPWATAQRHYTIDDDGLRQDWTGFVWCNPPFGRRVERWLQRMAAHRHGIALLPARTETRWFRDGVWQGADGVLFLHGRPRFHCENGERAGSTIGTPICLVGYGLEANQRLRNRGVAGTFATWIRHGPRPQFTSSKQCG